MNKANKSYHELYREGKHNTGYQPDAEHLPDGMYSFEVFGSLENGMKCYPEVPESAWMKYDFSVEPEPIEDVEFLD